MELASGWLDVVRRVIAEVSASDADDFELAHSGFRLRIKRRAQAVLAPSRPPQAAASEEGTAIVAPLTGIFYRSSSPSAAPFCQEGDWVEAGATVGLIETMKIFNEVKTEQTGRVAQFLVQSGQLVQAGEPLARLLAGEQTQATRI